MDLFKTWDKVNERKFTQSTLSKKDIMKAIHSESNSAIVQLKKRLFYKLLWIIVIISTVCIWMLFSIQKTELMLILSFFLLQGLLFLIPIWLQYKKMSA